MALTRHLLALSERLADHLPQSFMPMGQGQQPGMGQEPGMKPGQGMGLKPGPGQEQNEAQGTGNRLPDGQLKNAPSRVAEVKGDGSFASGNNSIGSGCFSTAMGNASASGQYDTRQFSKPCSHAFESRSGKNIRFEGD